MVLTGKQSLDFSGGVSAEDNFGIGGYDRIMGPNGQAQYWAPDLRGARDVLMSHYDHSYVAPGESGPRKAVTGDPVDRDVSTFPHAVPGQRVHDGGRDLLRRVQPGPQEAVRHPHGDAGGGRPGPRGAGAVGGHGRRGHRRGPGRRTSVASPVCLLGHRVPVRAAARLPAHRRPGHLHRGHPVPAVVKKAARAINAASGNRPLVVLANLSGFDGSPESMRKLQLEYGAEIGRAIVNFDGPIVFCVISRYHGGAFVVFSKALNPNMTVLAVEGSFASVLGGAPAAAVVFAGDVDKRTAQRPAGARAGGPGRGGRRRRRGPRSPRELAELRPPCGPRSSARWPPSSTACTASSGRSRSARWTRSSAAPSCGRRSSRRWRRASPARSDPALKPDARAFSARASGFSLFCGGIRAGCPSGAPEAFETRSTSPASHSRGAPRFRRRSSGGTGARLGLGDDLRAAGTGAGGGRGGGRGSGRVGVRRRRDARRRRAASRSWCLPLSLARVIVAMS